MVTNLERNRCIDKEVTGVMNEELSLLSRRKMSVLMSCLEQTERVPGDIAELGVYQGGSAFQIASMSSTFKIPEPKKIHLFDTFSGLPHTEQDLQSGEFAASLDDVKKLLKDFGICWHVGIFPDTIGACEHSVYTYSFVHLDADLYESTRAGLEFFLPRMNQGGIIVVDDYDFERCPGVRRAISEANLTGFQHRAAHWQYVIRREKLS